MQLLKVFALSLVATVLLFGSAFAQNGFSPPAVNLPWNDYRPSRINNDFTSIIGDPGTKMLSRQTNVNWRDLEEDTIHLPFEFNFIRTMYPAGTPLVVGTDGYLSFNRANNNPNPTLYQWFTLPYFLQYTTSTTRGYFAKVVAPYWTNLETVGVSSETGAVYYKVTGSNGNRVLIVEWRARSGQSPISANPGNFQAKLFEKNFAIEFHYGDNSINKTSAGWGAEGAVVGLKNFGQRDLGREPNDDDFGGKDEDNFLLMIHPNQPNLAHYPALGDDTVAITRVRTMNNWWFGENYPEYDANDFSDLAPPLPRQARVSPYFHYSFPNEFDVPIAYRIVPILNDLACDSVWFFPSAKANAYPKEAEFTVSARFQNRGANTQNNAPVRMDIIRNGIELAYSDTKFISPGGRLGTDDVDFAKVLKTVTTRTGLYEVQIYPQLPGEEDFRNDTCKIPVFIQGQNDVMALQVLQPLSNVPPLFNKYPVGVGVQIEARFLNIGILPQRDVQVGYSIYDANGEEVYKDVTIIEGNWPSLDFRDRLLPAWTPQQPGDYFLRAYTLLPGDEQILNDTVPNWRSPGKQFSVRYEIEVSVSGSGLVPPPNSRWPLGKPIPIQATFINNGLSDATNTPAQVIIKDPNQVEVYNRTITVLDIVAEGGAPSKESFPFFIPNSGPGQYCATVKITNAQDPVVTNNQISWCFEVAPHLSGQIFVGFGERFETIQEAKDSLYFYGVSGPVEFILVDDEYTVGPGNNDASQPALDFRGEVVGLGVNAPVTWMPHPNKTEVKVHMQSPSGIGFWYGQIDTINPAGYITWDGGAKHALRFVYENTGLRDFAAPFYFGRGASNYAVRNSTIEPLNIVEGYKETKTISIPEYDQSFNRFLFVGDLGQQVSAGIMVRNSMPIDPVTGTNKFNADSLRNQDNVFEGNHIRNFAYGILSIGAGPVYDIGLGRFVEYNNQNNTYRNNLIEDMGRAGVAVAFETGSGIFDNTIRGVDNDATPGTRKGGASTASTDEPHAAGIWVTAGGNGAAPDDRGYSTDLSIERNMVSDIRTGEGVAVGIWVETNENELLTPASITFRLPENGASNISVRNNMAWDYSGPEMSAGIGVGAPESVRGSYIARNNRVENNTVYNANLSASTLEVGIGIDGSGGVIRNNIIAVVSGNGPVGLGIVAHDERGGSRAMRDLAVESDYNLFWVPNGAVGSLEIVSPAGFTLPSPPAAVTIEQWRFRTGLDENSLQGNVLGEFVSTTPGAIDLHIDPLQLGALTSNRGMQIEGLTQDIDREPRGAAATRGRYDIGADEYVGQIRNNDVTPVAVLGPMGYQAASGQFSDAEYMMVGSDVDVTARIRNIGGRPVLSNMVQVDVEYWTGSSWVNVQNWTQSTSVDVAEATDVNAGVFQPQTLAETGVNDPFYGLDPNVTPIYRFRVTTGLDDNLGNNVYEKRNRFYVQRSDRRVLVPVEDYDADPVAYPSDVIDLGNKLNADALLSALSYMRWERSDATPAGNDYDLFERDRWPRYALDFTPWQTVIWSQGEESEGMLPEERWAIKEMLDGYNTFNRAGLIISGQEVARKHDVALTAGNGQVADKEFVNDYLRAAYLRATVPAVYEGRIQGIRITPGRYDLVKATGVANDLDPMPGVVATTLGEGIAQGSHWYVDQTPGTKDSLAGTTISNFGNGYNVVHYAIDWRHFGRFDPDAEKSGINRVVLGAIDFLDQYGSILPVELTSFNAYQSSREAVTVEWTTASEVEVSAMEIERAEVVKSESGERTGEYRSIDRQSPKGDVTRGADYRTVDGGVKMGGEYSYRLVVVDMDGSRTVDQTARVKVRGGAEGYELTVQPNPMRSTGTIEYRVGAGDRSRMTVYDVNGKVVLERELRESTGSVVVPVSELSSGRYNVVLETTSGERLNATLTVSK